MKTLVCTTVSLLLLASIPATAATRFRCTGDAARSTPPVVNYPTHIRNVVWRNMRAVCQQQPKQSKPSATPNNSQSQETPQKSQ
ncbi:hypothetical protein C7B65_25340 [Phormidesmis priestleyi ULC007]|uniref:Secreted protein n=1 Tax=Phormidesmis priestleyi ULC007 TaxID=1920490 RepID=A0A2T1D3G8_9CYAN|nr:hypothetical protein [Phormidesmis priestleyi]PSB15065.1 hypothetical protein C7B65_25340 [Phormidesmis priestleyi ULC007]